MSFSLQAALTALEQEAKENVYAVLDPHVQYELTINKYGEPPTYLSLSKPLTHQRTHAFDPQNLKYNEINNNCTNRNRLPNQNDPRLRRSDRSYKKNNKNQQSYLSRSNQDVKYSVDPNFGTVRAIVNNNISKEQNVRDNARSGFNDQSRMYDRNNSARKSTGRNEQREFNIKTDVRRASNRSRDKNVGVPNELKQDNEKECSFQDSKVENKVREDKTENDTMPRPGKVKELASRFDRNNTERYGRSVIVNVDRPKTLESFDQAYLNHVFPEAIEI